MRHRIYLLNLLFIGLLLVSGCKKDDEGTDQGSGTPAVADATIEGTIITPSGELVKCAQVTAGSFSTKSDANGRFSLDVQHGNVHLVIQTGRGDIFKTELSLVVDKGQTLELTNQQRVLLQVGNLAVVPGAYDAIEILIDSLGYTYSLIQISDLSSASMLNGYDAIFFNCGALEIGTNMDSVKYLNLLNFIQNNGSIYASDWAVEVLTGDGFMRPLTAAPSHTHSKDAGSPVNVAATCISPMLGGFIADSALCTSKNGASQMLTGATVVDPDLITVLGQNTIDIEYDLGAWEMIHQIDIPFTPLITDASLGTLAVKSYYMGENGGRIFYTTFHNEPQQAISNHVRDILNYFILNL